MKKTKYKKIIVVPSRVGQRPIKLHFYEKKTGKRVSFKAYETYERNKKTDKTF